MEEMGGMNLRRPSLPSSSSLMMNGAYRGGFGFNDVHSFSDPFLLHRNNSAGISQVLSLQQQQQNFGGSLPLPLLHPQLYSSLHQHQPPLLPLPLLMSASARMSNPIAATTTTNNNNYNYNRWSSSRNNNKNRKNRKKKQASRPSTCSPIKEDIAKIVNSKPMEAEKKLITSSSSTSSSSEEEEVDVDGEEEFFILPSAAANKKKTEEEEEEESVYSLSPPPSSLPFPKRLLLLLKKEVAASSCVAEAKVGLETAAQPLI